MGVVMDKPLTIGRLADSSGVNIETIRYYQRIGIINEPDKPREGYRIYPPADIERILFIKRAQQLGFSLKEIADLLELGDGHCSDIRHQAELKCDHIKQQINDLQKLQQTLETLIDTCHTDDTNMHCPIVETLTSSKSYPK